MTHIKPPQQLTIRPFEAGDLSRLLCWKMPGEKLQKPATDRISLARTFLECASRQGYFAVCNEESRIGGLMMTGPVAWIRKQADGAITDAYVDPDLRDDKFVAAQVSQIVAASRPALAA